MCSAAFSLLRRDVRMRIPSCSNPEPRSELDAIHRAGNRIRAKSPRRATRKGEAGRPPGRVGQTPGDFLGATPFLLGPVTVLCQVSHIFGSVPTSTHHPLQSTAVSNSGAEKQWQGTLSGCLQHCCTTIDVTNATSVHSSQTPTGPFPHRFHSTLHDSSQCIRASRHVK